MASGAERLSEEIVALCRGLGFAQAGIADASPTRWAPELMAWLAAGKHGSMAYLERQLEARLDPRRVLPGANSVVMVADQYWPRGVPDPPLPPRHGRIARYARGNDYHAVMKRRLHRLADLLQERFPGERFRAFVDTAPVLEREYAARAGLGWIAKNTLVINPALGSYLLLGGVLTTLDLAPPPDQRLTPDHCGTCTRCIDACPTHAISPYSVDASRCISYLTIERRGPIPPEFHPAIGNWLFGCDICQDVCPHNSPAGLGRRLGSTAERAGDEHAPIPADYSPRRHGFDVLDVLGWTAERRADAFRGSSLKRATLDMMKRNAVIAAGNMIAAEPKSAESAVILARVRALAADAAESEPVRHAAAGVLSRFPLPGRDITAETQRSQSQEK